MIRLKWIAAATLVLASQAALADAQPSFNVVAAPALMDPGTGSASADYWYCNNGAGCTTSGTVDLWSSGYPVEITALARALHNNSNLIYEYVRDNIEYVPMYGLQKGALGAIIDRSGTAFDQAQLMVDLLRASGYTASYIAGNITLNGTQIQQWLNVTDAGSLSRILADGGIPATVTPSSGPISSATISHVWVSYVDKSGKTIVVDPAYKPHNFTPPISFSAATQWNASTFLATQSGMTSGTVVATDNTGASSNNLITSPNNGKNLSIPYVGNINVSGLETQLNTYASNTLAYLRGNGYQTQQIDDVLGRHDIVAISLPTGGLTQAALPYPSSLQHTWTGNVPDVYRTRLTVEMENNATLTRGFWVDEIYGRRLAYDHNFMNGQGFGGVTVPSWSPIDIRMTVDYQPVMPDYINTTNAPGNISGVIRFSVDHPYAAANGTYMDQTVAQGNAVPMPVDLAGPVMIVMGFGDVSPDLASKMESEQVKDTNYPVGGAPPCPPTGPCKSVASIVSTGDKTLLGTANSWLVQYSGMAHMQAQMLNAQHQQHHVLGVIFHSTFIAAQSGLQTVADEQAVLNLTSSVSVNSRGGVAADRATLVQTLPAAADALESGVFEQSMDVTSPASVSTRFRWAAQNMASSNNFYLVPSTTTTQAATTTTSALFPGGTLLIANIVVTYGSPYWNALSYLNPADSTNAILMPNSGHLGPGNDCAGLGYSCSAPGMTKGGAFIAFGNSGTTSSITHAIFGAGGIAKGGGAGDPPAYAAEFSPATPADQLKDKFKDRTKDFGIDLLKGSFSYAAPADISVGNGGFPYELSFQRSFDGATTYSPGLGQGWTDNMDIRAQLGSSGLEALGQSSPLNAAYTLTALYALQQIQSSALQQTPLSLAFLQKAVLTPFINRWWTLSTLHNTVTRTSGASQDQFVKLPDGTFNPAHSYNPGDGSSYLKLTMTGAPVLQEGTYGELSWYDVTGVSFSITSPAQDVQNFAYWAGPMNPAGLIDPNGQQRGWQIASWQYPYGVNVSFNYAANLLTSVSNNLGRSLTLNYNQTQHWPDCWITSITDGQGRTGTYTCGTTALPATNYLALNAYFDPNQGERQYQYTTSASGGRPLGYSMLSKVFSPSDTSNAKLALGYDGVWHVQSYQDATSILYPSQRGAYQFYITGNSRGERMDPIGYSYAAYYDAYGRGTEFIDELGRISTATYDGLNRVLKRTDPEGNYDQFSYNGNGSVTLLQRFPSVATTPTSLSVSASYNPSCGKIAQAVDARGNTTQWGYSQSTCLPSSIIQPAVLDGRTGNTTSPITTFSTYNSYGQPTLLIDPTGLQVQYTYDSNNYRHSRVVDPNNLKLTTTYGYDAFGDINAVTDGNNNLTSYGYDNNRRVGYQTSGASPNCVYTKYGRDLDGDITAVVRDKDNDCSHSQVVTKTTSYTATKEVNTVTDEMGYQTITAYDGDDRPQLVTQWLNSSGSSTRVTRTDYDAAGQTHDVIKGYGNPDQFTYATYAYFPNGEVQSVLDANNNQTSSTYDGYDRLSTLTFANGSTEQYGYDNNGNLTSRKNRDGVSLSFGYDVLNREISRTVPPNAAFTVTRTLSSQYDLASRKWNLAVTEGSTSQALQYGYDTAGRLSYVNDGLLNTLQPGSAIGNVSYGYDGNSNRTLLAVYTNGASWIPTYNYDTLERLSSITSGSYTMDRFGFDGLSRLASETFLDTSSVAYVHQDNDDLTSLTHNYYGGSLTLGYTTNGAHQIVSQTSSDLSFLSPPAGASSQAYSPNNLNQYSSVAGASLGYDGNGNLTGNNGWTYGYDEENRLRTASGNGHSISYAYDPLGRRRSKTVDGLTTYFISDGPNELAETDASGNRQRLYLYADGTDKRVATYTDALGYWDFYHTDHQGSTLMMSRWISGGATNGMSDGSFHYDPYGVAAASDPSTGNPFRYTGRYLDAETGLYYYRARYYSPALGRFLQTDPIGTKSDLDLYAYTGNDPLNHTDPSGNCFEDACVGEAMLAYMLGTLIVETAREIYTNQQHSQPAKPAPTTPTAPSHSGAAPAAPPPPGDDGGNRGGRGDSGDRGGRDDSGGGRRAGNDNESRSTLPRDQRGNYLPHEDAEGPHSTIGERTGSDGSTYRQGATFDENGTFKGRTDVTDHGRSDHTDPHFHEATGPNSVKPGGVPIKPDGQ